MQRGNSREQRVLSNADPLWKSCPLLAHTADPSSNKSAAFVFYLTCALYFPLPASLFLPTTHLATDSDRLVFSLLLVSSFPLLFLPGSRQEEGPGGDQGLHHPVPGQRGLPDQRLSEQCAAAAGHPGLATATHGVLHQPHLPGQVHIIAREDTPVAGNA